MNNQTEFEKDPSSASKWDVVLSYKQKIFGLSLLVNEINGPTNG